MRRRSSLQALFGLLREFLPVQLLHTARKYRVRLFVVVVRPVADPPRLVGVSFSRVIPGSPLLIHHFLLLLRLLGTLRGLLLDAAPQLQGPGPHDRVRCLATAVHQLRHLVPRRRRKGGVVPTPPHLSEVLYIILVLRAPDRGLP